MRLLNTNAAMGAIEVGTKLYAALFVLNANDLNLQSEGNKL